MEKDYRGWCESLVALGEVEVVRLEDREGRPLVICATVGSRRRLRPGCRRGRCGAMSPPGSGSGFA